MHQQQVAPPHPPPPQPPNWTPPRPARRRRWPFTLALFAVLAVICCCGCPGYFAKPVVEQYPAEVVLPETIADFRLRDDSSSRRLVQELEKEIEAGDHFAVDDTFAAVYGDRLGKRVAVFGTTGLRLTPKSDLEREMTRLTERYALTELTEIDSDTRGQHQQCALGNSQGVTVVVCGWADHGSLGVALFTRRSLPESAALLPEFRDALIIRG